MDYQSPPRIEISVLDIRPDMKLRQMVVRNPHAKTTVLLLHGFPETIFTWKESASLLARTYEVRAFDWPGYGQSTRPTRDKFDYSPQSYAGVLKDYILKSKIDTSNLVVYATDIGALPALLLAIENPRLIKKLIVGDFAPLDRPQYMFENLRNLKVESSAEKIHQYMNTNKDGILENAFKNGLSKDQYFSISDDFKNDMVESWSRPAMSVADAFFYYYSFFTRDQNYFEANIKKLKTPAKIIWGEKDSYIQKEMGLELASKLGIKVDILKDVGHYPHLQNPKHVAEAVNLATGVKPKTGN